MRASCAAFVGLTLTVGLGRCADTPFNSTCAESCQNALDPILFADFIPHGTLEEQKCKSNLSLTSTYLCVDVNCGVATRRVALMRINATCEKLFSVALPEFSRLANYTREQVSHIERIHRNDTLGSQKPREEPVLPAPEYFHGWVQTLLQLVKLPLSRNSWLKRRLFLPAAFGYRMGLWHLQQFSPMDCSYRNAAGYDTFGWVHNNIAKAHVSIFEGRWNGFVRVPTYIWIFDRIMRVLRIATFRPLAWGSNAHASYTAAADIVQLSVPVEWYSLRKPKPGTFFYLTVLSDAKSRWQSHPFTVACVTTSRHDLEVGERTALLAHTNRGRETIKTEADAASANVQFLIRPYDGFTSQLRELAQDKKPFKVQLDGPYGTSHPLQAYSHVVFIAGGTGIVTPISYLPSITGNAERKPTVILHWAVREPAFANLVLGQYFDDALRSDDISMTLHASAFIDFQPLLSDFICQKWGRPNISSIIASVASSAGRGRLAVVACGPEGLDTGHGDQCCDNDSYCFVSTSGESRCCPLGSNCVADSECNSKSYYCTRTTTPTLISSIVANATETGCCGRRCPQSQYYLCPANLGGNCCPYGAECRADGNCVAPMPTAATTATTLQPALPTSSCPSGSCTAVVTTERSRGMSTVTKACIAATVVGGTGLAAGLLTWLWLLRKKRRSAVVRESSSLEESSPSEVPGHDVRATDYFGIGAALPPTERAVPSQPHTPADITSPVEMDSAAPKDYSSEAGGCQKAEDTEIYELEATEVRQGNNTGPVVQSEACKE
ncbi:hypothetical protein PWT90_03989 [Aphanocladium album]|nr:hypothetical protein PWT90_03989 [Aphanocladium album]